MQEPWREQLFVPALQAERVEKQRGIARSDGRVVKLEGEENVAVTLVDCLEAEDDLVLAAVRGSSCGICRRSRLEGEREGRTRIVDSRSPSFALAERAV